MLSYRSQRFVALLILMGLIFSLFSVGSLAVTLTDPSIDGMTAVAFNGNTLTVTNGRDTNYEVVVYHTDDTETAATASVSGNKTTYSVPSGIDGELKFAVKKSGGSYVFSGTGKGNITVKKAATGNAYLYLNGLNLTSSFTSVITVNRDSTVTCSLYVMNNTVNTLTDSTQNNSDTNTANLAAESAVIKTKATSNLWLLGNGTLNLNGNAKNGIKANGKLTVAGNVKLNITAAEDGISGEEIITLNSGTIHITAKAGDGIKCGADAAATGDIVINGGTVTIDARGDGMQATANLTVNGGVLDITCYGGYTANYNSTTAPSAKGLKAGGTYLNASGTETNATECYLVINGGYIAVNSADDAIHSDKDVTITAGVLDLYTAGDGVHADYVNTIGVQGADNTDLYLTIHKCYEGIEGANVKILSGIINVFASDDSINAANSDLGSGSGGGGFPGSGSSSSYTFTVDISGGFIYCASSAGDCLDSNKNFTITGGTLVVLGSITSGDNTAVDTDGAFNIQGGEILTIGNSGMLTNPTTTQNYCTWTSAGTATASTGGSSGGGSSSIGRPSRPGQGGSSSGSGSVVGHNKQLTITDSNGNTLISVAVQWDSAPSGSAGYVLYSNSELVSGSSYTLSVGTVQSVNGGSNITTPSVAAQSATPTTDESATPAIPPEMIAAPVSTLPDDGNTDDSIPDDGNTDPDPTPDPTPDPDPTPPTEQYLYGDTDQNGAVNATDALWVLQAVVGKRTLTELQSKQGNVNGNETVEASDALLILQFVVGKIQIFPVETLG